MLNFDEVDRILVTNPFADDTGFTVSPNNNNHTLGSLTLKPSPQHHPLRSQSVSPAPRCDTQSIPSDTATGSEGETLLKSTPFLNLDGSFTGEDQVTANVGEAASRGSSGRIMHPVGPNDSFAGVALRYGVSIAALRRANQLWPSDPIHIRTELLIPRGDAIRARHKPIHRSSRHATLQPAAESAPDLSLDLVASSFVAARGMIVSMLPARISLDSLSSRASASEDHELDDLRTARAHKITAGEAPFSRDGYELSVLASPRGGYRLPGLPSHTSHTLTNNHHVESNHTSPVGDIRSWPISSSPRASLQRPPRKQPFAALPVRTSQLEPEPAMELPARRPRI